MRTVVLAAAIITLAGCATPNMGGTNAINAPQAVNAGANTPFDRPPAQLRRPPPLIQGWGGNAYGAPGGSNY